MVVGEKYGEVAIKATMHIQGAKWDPKDAWKRSAEENCDKECYVNKSCPRSVYLGLCEGGLIVGVHPGNYINAQNGKKPNKSYAVCAVHMLQKNPLLANAAPRELWRRVMKAKGEDPDKSYDYQMHVVLALWNQDMIIKSA